MRSYQEIENIYEKWFHVKSLFINIFNFKLKNVLGYVNSLEFFFVGYFRSEFRWIHVKSRDFTIKACKKSTTELSFYLYLYKIFCIIKSLNNTFSTHFSWICYAFETNNMREKKVGLNKFKILQFYLSNKKCL